MTLHTPKNGSHPDKNDISSGWQRESIFEAGPEPSIRPQRVAGLSSQCKIVCHLGIQ